MVASRLFAFAASGVVAYTDDPTWGCGLLGPLKGINPDGSTTSEMQEVVEGMKASSSFNMVTYWNWGTKPEFDGDSMQYLSEDFIFMPEQWGMGAISAADLQPAGQKGIKDADGGDSLATMATILLGGNEPDIYGSCMGNMFATCTGPCTGDEVQSGNCPIAHLAGTVPAKANPVGHCDCWTDSHATGVGFWSFDGCANNQPLPTLFTDGDENCIDSVINAWKVTASVASQQGFKYLSAPLVASNMDWMKSFVERACDGCSDMSCGCPTHVAWHFYAHDCRPTELGDYDDFQRKLDATVAIMEQFPQIKGAIVNEVGMLNCVQDAAVGGGACVPNGPNQKFPANKQPGSTCPTDGSNPDLPDGLGSFVKKLVQMGTSTKTSDGRTALKAFSWFNQNQAGGTYDLRLFDDSGVKNSLGQDYLDACKAWTPTEDFTMV